MASGDLDLEFLEPRLLELHDGPAHAADQVVVVLMAGAIAPLVACWLALEAALDGQVLLKEESQRAVDGRRTDGRVPGAGGGEQRVERDMPGEPHEGVEDEATLRGVTHISKAERSPRARGSSANVNRSVGGRAGSLRRHGC